MKKALLLGVMMISAVANAEVIEIMGRKIEVGENGMKMTDRLTGQVFGLENGKGYLKTGNDEVGTISTERVSDDTIRFGIGGASMDIKSDPNDPNTVLFLDPNGNVVKKITKTVDANGNEVVQIKDAADKITSEARKNGASGAASGFIHEVFPNDQLLDMQIENGEMVGGAAKLTGKKYKHEMRINRGNIEMIYKDIATNKVLCKLQGNDSYVRIYDGNGKLIAEGADEDNAKIYNQSAYDKCKSIMEEDDD